MSRNDLHFSLFIQRRQTSTTRQQQQQLDIGKCEEGNKRMGEKTPSIIHHHHPSWAKQKENKLFDKHLHNKSEAFCGRSRRRRLRGENGKISLHYSWPHRTASIRSVVFFDSYSITESLASDAMCASRVASQATNKSFDFDCNNKNLNW